MAQGGISASEKATSVSSGGGGVGGACHFNSRLRPDRTITSIKVCMWQINTEMGNDLGGGGVTAFLTQCLELSKA